MSQSYYPIAQMKFLFLIGIEGSGHHMFHSILEYHEKQRNFVSMGLWRPPLVHRWNTAPKKGIKERLLNILKPPIFKQAGTLKEKLDHIFEQYKQEEATHFFESVSFPFENPRNTLRRPDVIELVDTIEDMLEYKLLVLYRNPISATYSGIRRGFTHNVRLQAKIVEDNLIYIASQVSTIDTNLYKVIDFDEFLANPNAYVKPLAAWWDLDEELLAKGLQNIHEPTQVEEIPADIKKILDEFFTESRMSQWKAFYSNNKLEI